MQEYSPSPLEWSLRCCTSSLCSAVRISLKPPADCPKRRCSRCPFLTRLRPKGLSLRVLSRHFCRPITKSPTTTCLAIISSGTVFSPCSLQLAPELVDPLGG